MKKTGLVFIIFFLFQTAYASFPKPATADSAQTSLPAGKPVGFSSGKLNREDDKSLTPVRLSFTQKLALKLLKHWLPKRDLIPRKRDWIGSVGGFLLGLVLGPIGYGISRLTNNEPLREGASLGFKVFLIGLALYIALVLFVYLLLALAAPK